MARKQGFNGHSPPGWEGSIYNLSEPLWPVMVPCLGTGLTWGHLAIQKCIETKRCNFNVSQISTGMIHHENTVTGWYKHRMALKPQ